MKMLDEIRREIVDLRAQAIAISELGGMENLRKAANILVECSELFKQILPSDSDLSPEDIRGEYAWQAREWALLCESLGNIYAQMGLPDALEAYDQARRFMIHKGDIDRLEQNYRIVQQAISDELRKEIVDLRARAIAISELGGMENLREAANILVKYSKLFKQFLPSDSDLSPEDIRGEYAWQAREWALLCECLGNIYGQMGLLPDALEAYDQARKFMIHKEDIDRLEQNYRTVQQTLNVGSPNIKKLKAEGDIEGLIEALNHEDFTVRGDAAQSLGEIGDVQAVEPLIAILNDEESYPRQLAVEALRAITQQDFGEDVKHWQQWWTGNEPLSDHAWMDIYRGVKADIALKRQGLPCKVKMIKLCDLVQYDRLPAYQELKCLVDFDEADLENKDKIFLFISHRWHNRHIPDDGTLIAKIFHFCLNAVIKNNCPDTTQTKEVHHSKSLSDKLTALYARMDLNDVLHDQTHFHQFEEVFASITTDMSRLQLIKYVLSRFYVWIDFCCLPQTYYKQGRIIHRTPEEEQQFLAGLDSMDKLLQKTECVILWYASEINRAWLFYEALMSVPQGTCSFMMPMDLIATLSTMVRAYHTNFSNLGVLNIGPTIDAFKEIGITATNHSDIRKIVCLMQVNLSLTEWKFRIIK